MFDTKIGKVFFIGIGGIGMSGIAEVLINQGFQVSGSDISENMNIERLRKLEVNIIIGHSAENINGASIVVISSAIERNNVELIESKDDPAQQKTDPGNGVITRSNKPLCPTSHA